MENSLESIKTLGFKEAGKWELDKDGKITSELTDNKITAENVVYAFIADEKVMYVGKTSRTLEARMQNYRNCDKTQEVNVRVSEEIKKILESGGNVLIYAMPNGDLEPQLIKGLSPEWNKQGVSK